MGHISWQGMAHFFCHKRPSNDRFDLLFGY